MQPRHLKRTILDLWCAKIWIKTEIFITVFTDFKKYVIYPENLVPKSASKLNT